MPELAEVEFNRKQWDLGLGQKVTKVLLHPEKRIFRGTAPATLAAGLEGAKLQTSEARGKQMLFHFAGGHWLGLHLGMTGDLRHEPAHYEPGKHDHLVLVQKKQALVFKDARLFGRVKYHQGKEPPEWWSKLPPALNGPEFTLAFLRGILARRKKAPLKAVLLNQDFFPGVGNWMADEILWQARLHPARTGETLTPAEARRLWQKTQSVCQIAMETIGVDWGDPPKDWLIHYRWKRKGDCPKHHTPLQHATIGGRTTAWCPRCQPES